MKEGNGMQVWIWRSGRGECRRNGKSVNELRTGGGPMEIETLRDR